MICLTLEKYFLYVKQKRALMIVFKALSIYSMPSVFLYPSKYVFSEGDACSYALIARCHNGYIGAGLAASSIFSVSSFVKTMSNEAIFSLSCFSFLAAITTGPTLGRSLTQERATCGTLAHDCQLLPAAYQLHCTNVLDP